MQDDYSKVWAFLQKAFQSLQSGVNNSRIKRFARLEVAKSGQSINHEYPRIVLPDCFFPESDLLIPSRRGNEALFLDPCSVLLFGDDLLQEIIFEQQNPETVALF